MVSFCCVQDMSSTEACWGLYLILQVAEHLVQVFSITPVSVGDEDKNGAEQLQQVAPMSPLKTDQPVSLWSLSPKREGVLVRSVTVFTANTHSSIFYFFFTFHFG